MFKTKKALKKTVERLSEGNLDMSFKIKEMGWEVSHYLEENRSLREENEELRERISELKNEYIAAVDKNYELAKRYAAAGQTEYERFMNQLKEA